MFFLGIDAGGTTTAFALGDESRIIATASSGTIKLGNCSESAGRDALIDGLQAVCRGAGIRREDIGSVVVGLSGASIPVIRHFVDQQLSQIMPGARREIHGDHVIAHRAAFPDGVGLLIISGTGSICYGRNAAGRELRLGGHGPAISDEGSGTWIGREALRRSLLAVDVGVEPPLLKQIADRFADGECNKLIRLANAGNLRFSELVPSVLMCALVGDELAREVLEDAGRELARLAAQAAATLFRGDEPVAFSFSGSIAKQQNVRQAAVKELQRNFEQASFSEQRITPQEGALLMARNLLRK